MTTGIAWYREDEIVNLSRLKQKKTYSHLRRSGITKLVHWHSYTEKLPSGKTAEKNLWIEFGGDGRWLDGTFTHWCEFTNPLTDEKVKELRINSECFITSTFIPNVEDMIPIEYSEEEKSQIRFSKAILRG